MVGVHSTQDCRPVPLFPCICGDNGVVRSLGVENYARREIMKVITPGGCHLAPRYCYRCIGLFPERCPDTVCFECYWELDCVPMEFKRLGPESRALVMSLYRAIVERFYIMRATGDCRRRPADPNFAFGGVLTACNNDPDKRALAGENRRRAFGGTFRDAWEELMHAYRGTASPHLRCCVYFYPMTPYTKENLCYPAVFMPCAKEYGSSDAISWWGQNDDWRKILTDTSNNREAMWVLDNTMQPDLSQMFEHASDRRGLLKAISQAYISSGLPLNDLDCYVSSAVCFCLPDTALKSFSDCDQQIARCCGIRTFTGMVQRFFGGCRIGHKYSLPALALALRMLSTLNAQTVRRERRATIPHKRITAKYTLPFGVANRQFVVGSEAYSFRMCCVNFACAVTCAYLSYEDGGAAFASENVYYNLDDRQPPSETCCVEVEVPTYACVCVGTCYSPPYPHYEEVCIGFYGDSYPHYVHCYCDEFGPEGPDVPYWHDEPIYLGCFCDECSAYPHYRCDFLGCFCDPIPHYECRCVGTHTETCIRPNPGYTCVSIGCYSLWGTRAASTAPTTESDASVTFKAVWPDLSGADFAFGGKAYPARWAVEECDVAFGAVSAFVRGATSDKRAWVVNKTDRPKHTLGGCRDLMTVLGRGLMRAALKRTMEDQGGVCGNTFSGAEFPVSEGNIRLEMVGQNHDHNIEMIRCYAEQEDRTAGAASWLKYHHLKVNGGCIIGYVTADDTTGIQIDTSPEWYDGRWLLLATRGGGAISFDYRDDYGKCGDQGIVGTCVRHGWTLARTSMQFGGFFGTFIFNNRAARQT